jgi:hypothetical protein
MDYITNKSNQMRARTPSPNYTFTMIPTHSITTFPLWLLHNFWNVDSSILSLQPQHCLSVLPIPLWFCYSSLFLHLVISVITGVKMQITDDRLSSELYSIPQEAQSFSRSYTLLSDLRNSPNFVELEGSLPHLQQPATFPYSKPDQSSPCLPIPLPEDPS